MNPMGHCKQLPLVPLQDAAPSTSEEYPGEQLQAEHDDALAALKKPLLQRTDGADPPWQDEPEGHGEQLPLVFEHDVAPSVVDAYPGAQLQAEHDGAPAPL